MADAYLTTADVANFNKVDLGIKVSDVLDDAPLIARLAARTARGNTFSYTKKTGNPSVGFRATNDGVENDDRNSTKVVLSLAVMDASFGVDKAVAQAREDGWAVEMADEALAHLRAAMAEIEQQVLYGTGNDATGFVGLANQTNLDGAADAQVVNAAGTTASTAQSTWLIRQGPMDVELLWGQEGAIEVGEMQELERAGATGRFPVYYHSICGWAGLKVGSIYSAVRIANVTEDSGKGLTDDLIAQAISKFPASRKPDLIVTGRRSLRQLQSSRTATNPTGSPAPFPETSHNVPIITTDQASETEALLA